MEKILEEGQIVLCTVKTIVGTTVFVNIDDYGQEGTIITSEIAPGRIRNLRDYVVPNKKIVCKIIGIEGKNIDLSLRRVTAREKREIMDIYEKEKGLIATLRTITKDFEKIIEKIKQTSNLTEFFENAKENAKILEKLMSKEEAEKLLKILLEKKEKEIKIKKEFSLTCQSEDGLPRIKGILPSDALYIAAGKFSIEVKDKNYKDANQRMIKIIEELGKKAKQESCVFSVKE